MSILKTIVNNKKLELTDRKRKTSISRLEKSSLYRRETLSLSAYIKGSDNAGIIAEFKTKSPSKGVINRWADPVTVAKGYIDAGAAAVSVLTDSKYFGGSFDNLYKIRSVINNPVLQKDFIIDEYQLIEAKAYGADAVLLIAAILDREKTENLASAALDLGLEVLLEVHSIEEIEMIANVSGVVGVNNRNLDTFKTDIKTSVDLFSSLKEREVKISESGIDNPSDILDLQETGYDGFLIGESFMKSDDPAGECAKYMRRINRE